MQFSNYSKLKNLSRKWNWLKNLDLAKQVTTKRNYIWPGFKTWKKESRFLKNKTTEHVFKELLNYNKLFFNHKYITHKEDNSLSTL